MDRTSANAKRRGFNRAARGEHRAIFRTLTDAPEFQRLSPEGKLVFFILKLELGMSGIGVVYDAVIAQKTGYRTRIVQDAVRELVRDRWLVTETPVYWIRNGLRFEPSITMTNEKHRTSVTQHLRSLPKLAIVNQFADCYELQRPFPEVEDRSIITLHGTVQCTVGASQRTEEDTDVSSERRTENGKRKAMNTASASSGFEEFWADYPKRAGSNPKLRAQQSWNARIAEGVKASEIMAGLTRYRAFLTATGKLGTEFVKQATTFIGRDRSWTESWEIPANSIAGRTRFDRAAPQAFEYVPNIEMPRMKK
jgi:hypothetical protein